MGIEVKVNRLHRFNNEESNLKAFVDLEINEGLLVKGLQVMNSKNGLFVSMPRQKGKDNKWYEVVQTLTPVLKEKISQTVLAEYQKGIKS